MQDILLNTQDCHYIRLHKQGMMQLFMYFRQTVVENVVLGAYDTALCNYNVFWLYKPPTSQCSVAQSHIFKGLHENLMTEETCSKVHYFFLRSSVAVKVLPCLCPLNRITCVNVSFVYSDYCHHTILDLIFSFVSDKIYCFGCS